MKTWQQWLEHGEPNRRKVYDRKDMTVQELSDEIKSFMSDKRIKTTHSGDQPYGWDERSIGEQGEVYISSITNPTVHLKINIHNDGYHGNNYAVYLAQDKNEKYVTNGNDSNHARFFKELKELARTYLLGEEPTV